MNKAPLITEYNNMEFAHAFTDGSFLVVANGSGQVVTLIDTMAETSTRDIPAALFEAAALKGYVVENIIGSVRYRRHLVTIG